MADVGVCSGHGDSGGSGAAGRGSGCVGHPGPLCELLFGMRIRRQIGSCRVRRSAQQQLRGRGDLHHRCEPALAERLQITAFPPGGTLTVLPVETVTDDPITVAVEPHGGSLTLALEEEVDWGDPWSARPILFTETGTAVPGYVLRRWIQVHGAAGGAAERFTVPALPPGRYTACLLGREPATHRHGLTPTPTSCAPVVITPFADTEIRVPAAR